MAAYNRRCRFRFNLLLGLSFLLLGISASESTSRAQAAAAVDLDGQFEVLHEDFGESGRYLYFLNTSGGHIPLRFSSNPPTRFVTGDHVRVHGTVDKDGTVILASGGNVSNSPKAPPPPTGPLPNTFGAQSTLVILVNFQDAPTSQPYTVAAAQSLVFGTVNNFILENSYQQTWLTGDVVGWYTIPVSSTTCNISSIASYAQSAATAAGVTLSAYSRYVYAFAPNSACGFAGASNVGGSPSQSWINGDGMAVHTVAHELGHALGLWHSHLLDCGVNATIGSNCTLWEYGDILDVMGASQVPVPHYSAYQKERLGWLNSSALLTVTNSGIYTINEYETGVSPRALKILKSTDPLTGAKTWYYLESRQGIGFDAFLTNGDGTCSQCYDQTVTNGVLMHIGTDGNGSSGYLLDMTPATPTYYFWFDPSLAVGQTFQDPTAGVTLTTNWVTSTQAAVNVQFTGSVTVATNQTSYSPGQTVTTTATATYADSPVAGVSVNFTITKANGNVVTGSAKTGNNGAATYNLKLMKTDPSGTYLAGAASTIKGNPHTASTNAVRAAVFEVQRSRPPQRATPAHPMAYARNTSPL